MLERLIESRGQPEWIVADKGTEFSGQVVDQRAFENGILSQFITPGKPSESGYVEGFKGKLQDECLNENWFGSLAEARAPIEAWRLNYNRPDRTARWATSRRRGLRPRRPRCRRLPHDGRTQ